MELFRVELIHQRWLYVVFPDAFFFPSFFFEWTSSSLNGQGKINVLEILFFNQKENPGRPDIRFNMDGSLPTHARVVNVAGLPASASKTDSGSAVLPVPRCRRCGFILLSVFFLFLSLFGALYVNLLHAMPDFVDEGGNSTIGVNTHLPLFISCSHFVLIPIAMRTAVFAHNVLSSLYSSYPERQTLVCWCRPPPSHRAPGRRLGRLELCTALKCVSTIPQPVPQPNERESESVRCWNNRDT